MVELYIYIIAELWSVGVVKLYIRIFVYACSGGFVQVWNCIYVDLRMCTVVR